MLTIVPTPIGNLKDITMRGLEALRECDAIICEDTRRSSQLLAHYEIQKPLLILNDFNEKLKFPEFIERLKREERLCLISDAGTPLVNDPGFKLVRECIAEGLEIDSLPGPTCIIPALTMSGLPPNQFMFLGYPPDKPGHRQTFYTKMVEIAKITPTTFIIFISPYKIKKTLLEMEAALGDIDFCLAKELSKMFQKVETKKLSEWNKFLKKHEPKGEYVGLFYL